MTIARCPRLPPHSDVSMLAHISAHCSSSISTVSVVGWPTILSIVVSSVMLFTCSQIEVDDFIFSYSFLFLIDNNLQLLDIA